MKTPAEIYIEGNSDGPSVFSGTIDLRDEGYYIEYTDANGAQCIIGYSKGVTTITKANEPSYTLILEEGCAHPFDIETPYGTIHASTVPINIRSRRTKTNTTLSLEYDISVVDSAIRHKIKLTVTPLD